MNTRLSLLAAAAATLVLAGCAQHGHHRHDGPAATATLAPTAGSTTAGTVRFQQVGDRVHVMGDIRGLKPGAEHAFHVHEKGDCSSPDAMSAGGHFNPATQPHGRHGTGAHHVGDLPSIRADASGGARLRFAGPRLACAVIAGS
jgi:Cu-Zn family superoxide dismutase